MIRTQDCEVVETGGLVRVSHGVAEAEQTQGNPHWQATRVNTGPVRMTIGGGEPVSAGVTRYQEGAEQPTGSVMQTARREGGRMTVQLVPGVEASRTVIENAVREGLVKETSAGFYEDIAAQPVGEGDAAADDKQPEGEKPFAFFEDREREDWNADVENLSQPSFEQAIAGVIAAVQRGTDDFTGVGRALAEANGLDAEAGEDYAQSGFAFYRNALTRDLVKQGYCTQDNVGEFYESIMGHRELTRAMQEMAYEGKTETFRRLAHGWRISQFSRI